MSSVDVAVGVVQGKVVARWHEPVASIEFDPKNAYMIGIALSKAAMEAHRGSADHDKDLKFIADELAVQKVEITDQQRVYLINKVSSIIRSLQQQQKSEGFIAMHCVDAVLQETAR